MRRVIVSLIGWFIDHHVQASNRRGGRYARRRAQNATRATNSAQTSPSPSDRTNAPERPRA